MSEIKNPFLDTKTEDSLKQNQTEDATKFSTFGRNQTKHTSNIEEGLSTAELNSGTHSSQEIETETMTRKQTINNKNDREEEGIIEIKKESNFLKNIIIILIVLLILSILGLALWNFFNNNKVKPASDNNLNSNQQIKQNFTEVPNFEMKGNNFKASSVVVEE